MPIRIALVALPRILRDIVDRVLDHEDDMQIVARLDALDSLRGALVRTPADVLVVGVDAERDAQQLDPVLFDHPRLTCLAIAGDARRAFLYELKPRAKPLGDVSPGGLVDAIRASQRVGVV